MEMTLPNVLPADRLDALLDLWTRFMRSGEDVRELWYPDSACGCVGGGYSQTFDDMVEAVDARLAESVNAAIDSLPVVEQCAISHKHLWAVYRFREPVVVVYQRARDALAIVLPARGVY